MKVKRRPRHFVGCEGQSEQSYVKFLGMLLGVQGSPTHLDTFDAKGGDPLSIVESCVKQRSRKMREAGNFRSSSILLDGDRFGENASRDGKARALATKANVRLIVQSYDFECFLYRHIPGREHENVALGASLNRVLSVWPDYAKPADARWYADRLDIGNIHNVASVHPEFEAFVRGLGF